MLRSMRTHQYDFTHQFEYLLSSDHKIYQRSRDVLDPITMRDGHLSRNPNSDWHLFESCGVPYGFNHRNLLDTDEYIVEFSVCSEIIFAVSNFHRGYIYKPTRKLMHQVWTRHMGKPNRHALYLPHNRRSWAFSVSIGNTLNKRTDYIHPNDQNAFYEDANGNPHEFGFTATVFVLLKCGQKIMYWDTGLTPNFTRGFLSPLQGETQGQMIAAAGSTVFISVLDSEKNLRFFTRMHDYEIFGGCVGFNFSYASDNPQPNLKSDRIPLGQGTREIPLPGWQEHELNNCEMYHVSHHISIITIGSGNHNRELRVFATHISGQTGYLSKLICEDQWKFTPSADQINSHLRNPIYRFIPKSEKILKHFTGYCIQAPTWCPGIRVSLRNFHPLLSASEPSQIVIEYGVQKVLLNLHTVDGLNLMNPSNSPHELVGNMNGYLKPLRGTVVIPSDSISIASSSLEIYSFIQNTFLRYNQIANGFTLVADNSKVILESNDHSLKFFFTRPVSQEELYDSPLLEQINSIEYNRSPVSESDRLFLLQANHALLEKITRDNRHFKKHAMVWLGESIIGEAIRKTVSPIAHAMSALKAKKGDLPIGTMGKQAVSDIKSLLYAQRTSAKSILSQENLAYLLAVKILNDRIIDLSIPRVRSQIPIHI